MKLRCPLAVVLVIFLSSAIADEKAENERPSDDVQDLLFLAPQRPVLIRLHIRNGGSGFRHAWKAYIAKAFGAHDSNRDGQLSGEEIERFQAAGDPAFRKILGELSETTRSRTQEASLERHTNVVRAVAFSPDGSTLASGSDDKTIKLWDLATGKLEATLAGHEDAVRAVEFSPDGKTIASGSKDSTVKLWDAATFATKATLEGHEDYVTAVAFSPDGKTLASAAFDNNVKLWNVADGKLLSTLEGHGDPVWAIAFSPDGTTLASGGEDKQIRFWDAKTGKQRAEFKATIVWSLTFSPDGKSLASSGPDFAVSLWNVEIKKPTKLLHGHTGPVRSVAFSADGKRLVSAGWDKSIRVWPLAGGNNPIKIDGHTDYVECARFSPDGASVVSGSSDRSLRCWDAATGAERPFLRVGTLDVAMLGRLAVDGQLGPFRALTIRSNDIVNAAGQNESQGSATNQLIARLDADANGRISPAELENAHDALRKLDWDDDETIQLEELFIVETRANDVDQRGRRRPAFSDPFLTIGESGEMADDASRAMIARYDRIEPAPEFAATPAPTLASRELGFDSDVFKTLDADGDGQLDVAELKQLPQRIKPDVELAIRMGPPNATERAVEVLNHNDSSGIAVAESPNRDGASLTLGQNELEIAANSASDADARMYYLERFKQADSDNNGYLEPTEVKGNPVFEAAFAQIDADGDMKLFPVELQGYVTARTSSAASRVVLTAFVEGHNLFDILDVNGDGRLGRREFALAARRIGAWDANRDGQLEQEEIPEHFRLEVSRANPGLPGMPRAAANRTGAREKKPAARTGPAWFQKMDRNQDGDVSAREFLGPPSAFEKLDTNQDGLLDADEAAK